MFKNADQVGIVLDDLDKFLEMMEEFLGISGFEVVEYPSKGTDAEILYHGQASGFKAKIAFKDLGNFQVEVIQPIEGPSIYQDFLDERGSGLHHIRFTSESFYEICDYLESQGIKQIASGRGVHGSSRWAYYDTSKVLQGLIIEIRKPKF